MNRHWAMLAAFGALALPATATAADYHVTTTTDLGPAVPCADPANCTLRGAILAANANAGTDNVLIRPGSYVLAQGDLEVADAATIRREGDGAVTISGNGASRVFQASAPVTIEGVTIAAGRATDTPGNPDRGRGGAIYATDSLTLSDVVIEDSVATGALGGEGGGVYLVGVARFDDVVFRRNQVTAGGGGDAWGGGLYLVASGSTDLAGVDFADNLATAADGSAMGGGLMTVMTGAGTLALTGSTLDGNRVVTTGTGTAVGAGWRSAGVPGATTRLRASRITGSVARSTDGNVLGAGLSAATSDVLVESSTLDDNEAVSDATGGLGAIGGGVVAGPGLADLTLTNSTVVDNRATTSGATPAFGAGIAAAATATLTGATITRNTATSGDPSQAIGGGLAGVGPMTLSIGSSILAGNAQGSGGDCASGSGTSRGGNVLDLGAGCAVATQPTDVVAADPGVEALGANGGSTPTALLQPTSPALNRFAAAGGSCDWLTVDQRGVARPQDGSCDAGAVEMQPAPVPGGGGASWVPECRDLAAETPFQTVTTVLFECSPTVWEWDVERAPEHGKLGPIGPDGRVTYTPDAGFSGTDTFRYVARGGSGSSAPAVVTVRVGAGPATPPTIGPARCAGRTVTLRLNRGKVRLKRARVLVDGRRVEVTRKGRRWRAQVRLEGTPGQQVTVRIRAKRAGGKVVRRTRTLTVC